MVWYGFNSIRKPWPIASSYPNVQPTTLSRWLIKQSVSEVRQKQSSSQVLTKTGQDEVMRTTWRRIQNSYGGHQKWVVDSWNPVTLQIFSLVLLKSRVNKRMSLASQTWHQTPDSFIKHQTANDSIANHSMTRKAWNYTFNIKYKVGFLYIHVLRNGNRVTWYFVKTFVMVTENKTHTRICSHNMPTDQLAPRMKLQQ